MFFLKSYSSLRDNLFLLQTLEIKLKQNLKRLAMFSALPLTLAACSGGGNNDTRPIDDVPDNSQFPSTELWGRSVPYRAFDTHEINESLKILAGPNGSICYINQFATIENSSDSESWKTYLECLDEDGQSLYKIESEGRFSINDALFTPDSLIVIGMEFQENPPPRIETSVYLFKISRYSHNGELQDSFYLEDEPSEKERIYYGFADDNSNGDVPEPEDSPLVWDSRPYSIFSHTPTKLYEHLDHIYLLAHTHGFKVYQFDNDLNLIWDHQVMPPNFYSHRFNVAADHEMVFDNDHVYVATDLNTFSHQVYDMHFDTDLPKEGTRDDILVHVLDISDGRLQQELLIGHPDHSEVMTGLTLKDGSLWIGGYVNLVKFDRPNDTKETDLILLQASATTGDLEALHIVDVDEDDVAFEVRASERDSFIFAGATDRHRVDSNSWTQYGSGMILEMSNGGEILDNITWSEPRDVLVSSVLPLENGEVLFSSFYDRPITHTCDGNNPPPLCERRKSAVGKVKLK